VNIACLPLLLAAVLALWPRPLAKATVASG